MQTWHDIVRIELKRRGWSQRETARRLGISASYMSDLLHSRRRLTAKTAIRIEYVLGIPAMVLLHAQAEAQLAEARAARTDSVLTVDSGGVL